MKALPYRLLRAATRFRRDERGSAAILGAVLMVVIFWCGAFAVDLGSLYFERRTAQGAVDLAAIAAARDIGAAEAAATATLEANNIRNISALAVTPGHYRADPAIPAEERFAPDQEPFNAVRVELRQEAPLYLARAVSSLKSMTLTTRAVAVTTRQAAFSIGSRLLRLEGGIANAVLEALIGGSIDLTVMDYRALADADVKLFQFMDALASEAGLSGASYNEVLGANASVGQITSAMAKVTAGAGQTEAAHILQSIGSASNGRGTSVPLGSMIDLGPYGELSTGSPAPGFDPSVNAMGLVSAAAAVANGDTQVSLDLGVTIPGLANLQVDVAIGERAQDSAWLTVGERGATVRTAQTRLRIVATLAGDAGGPISVRVPLYAEIAYGEARLDDITCGANPKRDARVDVGARPGIAELWLGEIDRSRMDNFSRSIQVDKAKLLNTPLASVSGKAHAAMTNTSETILSFDWRDIEEKRVKTTSTREPVATLLDSLLRDLDLDVRVLGLSLGLPGLLQHSVGNVLAAATPALDQVLTGVLDALGISLGEADITVRGVRCDGSALVG